MLTVAGVFPPPTQRLRTFIRQNSTHLANIAETVALPKNQRSVRGREVTSLDLEGGVEATRESPSKQFPIFMTLVSLLQVILYYAWDDNLFLLFVYDPYRRYELWRYLTIMFIHESWSHLWGNIVLQVILGCILEVVHHWRRISILYICGVLGGSLAITVLDPQSYSLGASAGVYALLFAHLATIILNWNEMDNKCCRLFWLLLYICFDVGLVLYAEFVTKESIHVSNAAHFGGAVAGFIVAVLVLRNFEKHPWERRLQWILGVLMGILFAAVVVINVAWPSHYRKTEWNTDYLETFYALVLQTMNQTELRQLCFQDEMCKSLLTESEHANTANKTMSAISSFSK